MIKATMTAAALLLALPAGAARADDQYERGSPYGSGSEREGATLGQDIAGGAAVGTVYGSRSGAGGAMTGAGIGAIGGVVNHIVRGVIHRFSGDDDGGSARQRINGASGGDTGPMGMDTDLDDGSETGCASCGGGVGMGVDDGGQGGSGWR